MKLSKKLSTLIKLPQRKIALATLILGCFAPIMVQAVSYNIEVVLFKPTNPEGFANEKWPADWSVPNIDNSVSVIPKSTGAGTSISATDTGFYINGLQSSDSNNSYRMKSANQLRQSAAKLRASSRYEVISHFAWRQPGLKSRSVKPVRIQKGQVFNLYNGNGSAPELTYEVDGTIKVVLGRFLHVYTDLLYTHPVVQTVAARTKTGSIDGTPDIIQYENTLATNDTSGATLYGFNVKEHRKMRSKELHHLDHPMLGILVYATRVGDKS